MEGVAPTGPSCSVRLEDGAMILCRLFDEE